MIDPRRVIDAWGQVQFHGDDVVELLMRDHDITSLLIIPNESTIQYNHECRERNKTAFEIPPVAPHERTPEDDTRHRIDTWFMPEEYRELAVRERLLALCHRPDEVARVNHEMDLFEAHDMLPILRLMFFLVEHFRQQGIVWGVGRGSSVASYCLFLIGIHHIDALYYDLDITEFLKSPDINTSNQH